MYDQLGKPTNAVKYASGKYLELIKEAIFYSYEDNFQQSMTLYKQAIGMFPTEFYAYFHRGVEYFTMDNKDKSLEDLQLALKYCTNESFKVVLEGMILEVNDKLDEALLKYHKAAEIDPENDFAWFSIGYVDCAKENFETSIKNYEKSLQYYRFSPCIILNNIGWCYERLNEKDKALKCYERSLETNPRCIRAISNMAALCCSSFSDFDKGIATYKKIIDEIDRYNVHIILSIGDIYYFDKKQIDEAINWYKKGLLLDPLHAHPYQMLASQEFKRFLEEDEAFITEDETSTTTTSSGHMQSSNKKIVTKILGIANHDGEDTNQTQVECRKSWKHLKNSISILQKGINTCTSDAHIEQLVKMKEKLLEWNGFIKKYLKKYSNNEEWENDELLFNDKKTESNSLANQKLNLFESRYKKIMKSKLLQSLKVANIHLTSESGFLSQTNIYLYYFESEDTTKINSFADIRIQIV